jgi:hypothetical protein
MSQAAGVHLDAGSLLPDRMTRASGIVLEIGLQEFGVEIAGFRQGGVVTPDTVSFAEDESISIRVLQAIR